MTYLRKTHTEILILQKDLWFWDPIAAKGLMQRQQCLQAETNQKHKKCKRGQCSISPFQIPFVKLLLLFHSYLIAVRINNFLAASKFHFNTTLTFTSWNHSSRLIFTVFARNRFLKSSCPNLHQQMSPVTSDVFNHPTLLHPQHLLLLCFSI